MESKSRTSYKKKCQNYFKEFCSNTSIHGLKFLGEDRRSLIERIWWFTFLAVSVYFCITSMLKAYNKWKVSPVVVSFSTSETSISDIPFPAVTICPQVRVRRDLINYTDLVLKKVKGESFNEELERDYEFISMLCTTQWNSFYDNDLIDLLDGNELITFFMKVQPDFNKIINQCFWMGQDYSNKTGDLFIPIITKEGICYSFNLLDPDQIFTKDVDIRYYNNFTMPFSPPSMWDVERGYEQDSDITAFPYRTLLSGLHGGLDLTLYTNTSDLDFVCGDSIQGYKIILHNPLQYPYVKEKHIRVGLNQDVLIALKPTIMKTSKNLQSYEPQYRKCLFSNERRLRFFQVYDQKSCLQERLSNFTYQHCGCVGYFMFHDNSTPICGFRRDNCVKEATSMFYVKSNGTEHLDGDTDDLICLPTCDSLSFEAEISQTEWSWKEAANVYSTSTREFSKLTHCSRVQIFFKDMQFITSERNELYGTMDFLSSCGGLLGLFLGISLISFVEILYYLTLRLLCNFINNRKNSFRDKVSS